MDIQTLQSRIFDVYAKLFVLDDLGGMFVEQDETCTAGFVMQDYSRMCKEALESIESDLSLLEVKFSKDVGGI